MIIEHMKRLQAYRFELMPNGEQKRHMRQYACQLGTIVRWHSGRPEVFHEQLSVMASANSGNDRDPGAARSSPRIPLCKSRWMNCVAGQSTHRAPTQHTLREKANSELTESDRLWHTARQAAVNGIDETG